MLTLAMSILTIVSGVTFHSAPGSNTVTGGIRFTATVVQSNELSYNMEQLEENIYRVAYTTTFNGKKEEGAFLVLDERENKTEPLLNLALLDEVGENEGSLEINAPLGVLAVRFPKSNSALAKIVKRKKKRDERRKNHPQKTKG